MTHPQPGGTPTRQQPARRAPVPRWRTLLHPRGIAAVVGCSIVLTGIAALVLYLLKIG